MFPGFRARHRMTVSGYMLTCIFTFPPSHIFTF